MKNILSMILGFIIFLLPIQSFAVTIPQSVSGLAAWWDASDSSTVTSSGGFVSQWNDLSGNGENLYQSTSANQPSLSYSLGLGSVNFDGLSSYMISSDTNFSRLLDGTGATTFIVMSAANNSSNGVDFWSSTSSSSSQRYSFQAPGGGNNYFDYGSYTSNRLVVSSATYPTTGQHVWSLYGNNPGTQNFRYDGNLVATQSSSSFSTWSCPLSIGALAGCSVTPQFFAPISINEIIVYNAALSNLDVQKIEGYLACKWSLQSNLPSGHPYKSTCPSIISLNNPYLGSW